MLDTLTWHKAKSPIATLCLAHGAGQGKESDFMQSMAMRLAECQINVALFDFDYMYTAKSEGKRRPPARAPKLLENWHSAIAAIDDTAPLFIGGKSMGGRMATMLSAEENMPHQIQGVIALGYPFHPPGKPDKLRLDHFSQMKRKTLIIQGERDTFGNREEVTGYDLGNQASVLWLPDGDHSFKPRKKSGVTQPENFAKAAQYIHEFIASLVN